MVAALNESKIEIRTFEIVWWIWFYPYSSVYVLSGFCIWLGAMFTVENVVISIYINILEVSDHGRWHFLVYSTQPSAPPSAAGGGSEPAAIAVGSPSTPLTFDGNEQSSLQQIPYVQIRSSFLTSASTVATTNLQGIHSNDR